MSPGFQERTVLAALRHRAEHLARDLDPLESLLHEVPASLVGCEPPMLEAKLRAAALLGGGHTVPEVLDTLTPLEARSPTDRAQHAVRCALSAR